MILDRYLARRYLVAWLATFAAFYCILALFNLVEHVRRFSDETDGVWPLVGLTLLSVPGMLYGLLPLVTLFAAIVLFLALARSSELVVTRASGRSAIRALYAPGIVALLLGALAVAALNPMVAATSREYEARMRRLDGLSSVLTLSDDGLWLRQGGAAGQTVIRAARSNLDGTELRDVTFLTFAEEAEEGGGPVRRIEAEEARLAAGGWTLADAKVWDLEASNPEAMARSLNSYVLPSTLTADQIRDSFGTPASIPIWELPRFIARLEDAGFAARRHRVFLQMELASPLFLVAMVLVAAGFSLRHQRGRRTGLMVVAAVLTGFAAYMMRSVAQVLGENGQIAPALAAWAPPVAVVGAALGLLLHLEEA